MSKSVRDCTIFTVSVHSNVGIVRQNSRLRCRGILRLLLICFLFLSLPIVAHAQPGTYWAQQPNGTARPGGEGTGPHSFWMANVDNAMGGLILWTYSMNLTDAGGIIGVTATNTPDTWRAGQLWVVGGLNNNGTSGIRRLDLLTVDGYLTNSTAGNGQSRSIYNIGTITVLGGATNYGAIYNVDTFSVGGDLDNYAGARIGGPGDSDWIYTLNVSGTLYNYGPGLNPTRPRAEIRRVVDINAGNLINEGLIYGIDSYAIGAAYISSGMLPVSTITVAQNLWNGSNYMAYGGTVRQRRDAEIISDWYYDISVGGNLVQYFDGSIRARGGTIAVSGELYNAGEIRITPGLDSYDLGLAFSSNRWYIEAGSIFNDGRTWDQHTMTGGQYPMGPYQNITENGTWGIIYDAAIKTRDNLTNIGLNAEINGMVYADMSMLWLNGTSAIDQLYSMHVGGDLNNLDRASIFNYKEIIVHGDLNNRGATLVGGHWFNHSLLGDKYENLLMTYQSGLIHVGGNVSNTTETAYGGSGNYGGLIAGFDTFNISGSVYNDANSMITGSYTHVSTGPYGTDGVKTPYTIYGRRANVLGGVLLNGGFGNTGGPLNPGGTDIPSTLNVMGLSSNGQTFTGLGLIIDPITGIPTTLPVAFDFYGLYNEGLIRDIDIVSVGSNELGVLWNANAQESLGATLPTSSEPDPAGGTSSANKKPEGTISTFGKINGAGTITNIGVLNVTNLYNEGTISDIDTAINVAYTLVNTETGVLDGYSPSHVEWDYLTQQRQVVGVMADDPDVTRPGDPTRATLRVGESTSGANPLIATLRYQLYQQLGAQAAALITEETGIFNAGTITNFEQVISLGDMYNMGTIGGVPVQTISGTTSTTTYEGSVTTITVGANMPAATVSATNAADFYNAGVLANIVSVNVTRDLYLMSAPTAATGPGSVPGLGLPGSNAPPMFVNVGTITASRDIYVDTTVDGGYTFLAAGGDKAGQLIVTAGGELTIDPGSIASGWGVENSGIIWNGKPAVSAVPGMPGIPGTPAATAVAGGTLNSAAGITNELGAYIYNSGTISAYSDFFNYGTIEGKGIVTLTNIDAHFRNETGGTVDGGLLVNGNYTNAGGTIALRTGEVLRITNGTAFINGGTIDASAYQGVVGRQYLFLATDNPGDLVIFKNMQGGGSGYTGSVLDFSPVYGSYDSLNNKYIPGEIWSPNNQYYWLEVRRAYEYGRYAVTPNQIAVGEYIDTVGATVKGTTVAPSPLWNLLVQLDGISDNPANPAYHPNYQDHQGRINPKAILALDQLSGVTYANLGPASIHNIGVVNRSLADVLRSDVFKFSQIGNPNNAIRGQAIAPLRYSRWATLFGIGGTTKEDGNASGYRHSFGGVLAGIDRAIWTGTRVGGWLSLATGDITTTGDWVDENADVTNVMVGMYLRQEMYYGYGLIAAGFGVDEYKTQRNLWLLGHRAESKFNGTIGTAYFERGIDVPVYYATVQPYTSFQVVGVSQEKFKETMWNQLGQYSEVGLEGLKGSTDSYKMAIGARASSMPVPFRWGQIALTANTAWFHEFNKDNRNFTARFANPGGVNYAAQDTTFTIKGTNPKQDWFNFGFGLNMDRNSTRLFLNGDLFANNKQTLFSGGGGFITSW